jgi:hypothetical protein
MMPKTREDAERLVDQWRKVPERSFASRVAVAMLGGQFIGNDVPDAEGVSRSGLSQVRTILTTAGYVLEQEPDGAYGARRYRVSGTGETANGSGGGSPVRIAREVSGTTHPPVGSRVTVRSVTLGHRGALVVHLSDGMGNAWTAQITGHVGEGA